MSLVIDLHTFLAQSLYSQGNFDRCVKVLDDLLAQSVTIEEKLPAYFIKLTILFVTNRHEEGMPLTQKVFKELGFSGFPKKTNMGHVVKDLIKTKMLVKKHKDRITELPLCTDQSRKIAMGLLDLMVREHEHILLLLLHSNVPNTYMSSHCCTLTIARALFHVCIPSST